MTQKNFLDYSGLQRFLNKLRAIIPSKTSDLTNDSGFLTTHNPVDSSLSTTSENAVQNKVVNTALSEKATDTDVVHNTGNETVSGTKSFNSDLNLNYASSDVDDIVNSVAGSATLDNFVHLTGNETINGIKSFPDGVVANVTGSATSATNDGSGNVISTTYGKLGAANTWTENNTFYKQVCLTKVNDTSLKSKNSRAELGETNLSGDTYTQISFEDKNGDNFGYLRQVYGADGNNGFHFFVRNKFLNGVPDTTGTVDYSYFGLRLNPDKSKEAVFKASLRPYDSINSYNLGDATYQWNNLYAKNYFYNGTAWGLDKYNHWLKNQSFIGEQLGNEDSINTHTCLTLYGHYDTVQSSGMIITRMRSNNSQGGLSENGASRLGLDVLENGVRTTNVLLTNIKGYNSETGLFTRCEFYTNLTSSRLGTSTNPWKLINDVNPGALSLPDNYKQLVVDTTDWNTTGGTNVYTPPANGWLHIRVSGATELTVRWNDWRFGDRRVSATATDLSVIIPVIEGVTVDVVTRASGFVNKCAFFPGQGNV